MTSHRGRKGRGLFRAPMQLVRQSYRVHRGKFLTALLLVLAGSVAAPMVAAALRVLTNAVARGDVWTAMRAGVVAAVLTIASLTFGHFAHVAYFELADITMLDLDERLIGLTNETSTIEHHERPGFVDELTVVQGEVKQTRSGLEATLHGIALAVTMLLTATLLVRLHPVLLLLPLVAVPPLLAGRRAEALLRTARYRGAEDQRLARTLMQQCTTAASAKEVRVLRLQGELRRRHSALWHAVTRRHASAARRAWILRSAGQLSFALGYVAAVLLVLHEATVGHRSVGDVVLVITLATQVNQQVASAVDLTQQLHRIGDLHAALDRMARSVTLESAAPAAPAEPVPYRLWSGIELDHVGFRYRDASAPVLLGVNLFLPAGATVAVVGENGAGKSTFVKLLCGLYQPVSGAIRVDGIDLRRMPVIDWRTRIAAGFQDFTRYELPARQCVGVGDLRNVDTTSAIEAALGRAQATDVVNGLPAGLDTPLGKSSIDGVDLSGGQWQKLALGRAFMRSAPLLLVLDEPTAALDAEAEHRLFQRYAENARRLGRSVGTITVLVSHRFSTVRMADLIVVLAHGRVVEVGDHDTLLAQRGSYAELFRIQGEGYRLGAEAG